MSKPIAQRTHKQAVTAQRRGAKRATTHPRRLARQVRANERANRTAVQRLLVLGQRIDAGYSLKNSERLAA
jgi:hypothetical protein